MDLNSNVEKLKLKILTMKKEIARKQIKLQKCKKVTAKRNNDVDNNPRHNRETDSTILTLEVPKSPEIGLMGKNSQSRSTNSLSETDTENNNDKKSMDILSQSLASEFTDDITMVQGTQTATTVRRSSRVPRESQLIASGDFLIERNIGRKRRASIIENDDNDVRKLFPVFPPNRNDSTDFVLPDAEFAGLKLTVRKTKQLFNLVQKDIVPQMNLNTEIASQETLNKENILEGLKFVGNIPTATKRVDEPIVFIHCGRLANFTAVITVQLHWLSTWINLDDRWSLIKETKRDIASCQIQNIHGVVTNDSVAVVCIVANKDKQRLSFWIYICDVNRSVRLNQITVEPDFHVMTGVLLSSVDYCFNHGGAGDAGGYCEITVANVWARTSKLKHVRLGDTLLRKIKNEMTFTEVDDNLNSLVGVDGLQRALLGTGSSMIFIWNRTNGQIIKTIEIRGMQFSCKSCVFCQAEKGLLFMGMLINRQSAMTTNECSLIVVNPNTSMCRATAVFLLNSSGSISSARRRTSRQSSKTDKDNFTSTVQLKSKRCGRFLVNVVDTSSVYVWQISTGKRVAQIGGQLDAATVHRRSSETLLFVAERPGNIGIYSITN